MLNLSKPTAKEENYRFFSATRELVVDRTPVVVEQGKPPRLEALLALQEGEHAVILLRGGRAAAVVAGALPVGVTMERLKEGFAAGAFAKEYYAAHALESAKAPLLLIVRGTGSVTAVVRIVHWFDEASLVDHKHVQVVVGDGASLQLVEEMVSDESAAAVTAAVAPAVSALTEISVAAHGRLSYFSVQNYGPAVRAALRLECRVEEGARAEVTPVIRGGDFTQLWIEGFCVGKESHIEVRGALRLATTQWAEIISVLHHPAAHSSSHQEYATAASGRSRVSFSGNIIIPRSGRHVEADLRNRNLLLSRDAEINTNPKLEISTADVKCAHGATVSSVSPDQLYYLQSRGISLKDAEEMIVRGFSEPTLARLPTAALRERAMAAFERLS